MHLFLRSTVVAWPQPCVEGVQGILPRGPRRSSWMVRAHMWGGARRYSRHRSIAFGSPASRAQRTASARTWRGQSSKDGSARARLRALRIWSSSFVPFSVGLCSRTSISTYRSSTASQSAFVACGVQRAAAQIANTGRPADPRRPQLGRPVALPKALVRDFIRRLRRSHALERSLTDAPPDAAF